MRLLLGITGVVATLYTASAESAVNHSASPFEHMLMQIYLQHPQLIAQRQELQILDERVSQANAGFRPSVAADIAYGRQRARTDAQPWQYGDDQRKSLVATQPVFNGFGTLAEARAARERVAAGRAELLASEQEVFFSAIQAWLDVCEAEIILRLNQDNVYSMQQFLGATTERYKAGDGTMTDVALAESRLAAAESRLATAEANRDIAHAFYLRETGKMPQVSDFPPLPSGLPAGQQQAVELAAGNPDLAQAIHIEEAAEHDIDSAASSLWPSAYIQGSMQEERSTSFGLGKLRNDSLTFNVRIPLYQGGAEYSRVREAKIVRARSRQDTIDAAREVRERAMVAWSNFHSAGKIIAASHTSVEASTQALSGIAEEHAQGTRTLTEVLDAQSDMLDAQLSEARAKSTLRVEAYRVMASVGMLTVQGLHLPVEMYDPDVHYDDVSGRWVGTSIDTPYQKTADNAQ